MTKSFPAAAVSGEVYIVYARMAKWRLAKALGVDLRLNALNLLLAQSFRSSFVLADTSQLHTKITEMGQRIRQLEDALAISHSGISNEPHPLLRDELLSIKFGPENGTTSRAPPSRDPSVESIDAFGTLTIFDRDLSKYFGRSAGSEVSVTVICLDIDYYAYPTTRRHYCW